MFTSEYNPSTPWIIALTGASGTVYGRRLISVLLENSPEASVDVVVSEAALRVMAEEEGIQTSLRSISIEKLLGAPSARVRLHNNKDIGAPIASGSYQTQGMVICPCSMSTLGAIANGCPQNLIHRAADVTLKEQRKLVLVPRETPLSQIHLENLLRLSRLGVSITPAMPGFYHQPNSISDLVDMMVLRIMDQMGIHQNSASRWQGGKKIAQGGLYSV